MTDKEKIIKIIEKNGTYNGRSLSFDYYVIQPDDLTDALIENGYGNVAEWKRRAEKAERDVKEWKRRAEVAEKELERYKRALYNISRRYELMSGFSENEADLFELTEVRIGIELDVADKEIEEERK